MLGTASRIPGHFWRRNPSKRPTAGLTWCLCRQSGGTHYTRSPGNLRVFWQGPSIGFDAGAADAGLQPAADRSDFRLLWRHQRFGLFHWRLLLPQTILLWFQSAQGLRLGGNLSYLKLTDSPPWNPFCRRVANHAGGGRLVAAVHLFKNQSRSIPEHIDVRVHSPCGDERSFRLSAEMLRDRQSPHSRDCFVTARCGAKPIFAKEQRSFHAIHANNIRHRRHC